MKLLWRMGKEAIRYRTLYVVAILSTLSITVINLIAPRLLSAMTGIVADGVDQNGLNAILRLTAWLGALYLVKAAFRFFASYLSHKAAWHLVGDLRTKLYDRLQRFSMSFFHDKQTGDLMSRVVNDTRDFELLYAHIIPDLMTNILTFLGVLTMLLTINPRLALLTCCPIPLVMLSGRIYAKTVSPYFKINNRTVGELNAKLQDNLSGIHEIQSFVREDEESERVRGKVWENVSAMLKALRASALFAPSVELFSSIGTLIVVGVGGVLAFRSELSVADIVAFLLYLSMFYAPISNLANMLEGIQQNLAGAERVAMILDTPSEITDRKDAVEAVDVRGDIEFDHVTFGYDAQNPVLRDVSFKCPAGGMVAFVGPTGVGKTTLTQLISRVYEPQAGRILLDGRDIADLTLKSLRRSIAPVLQDTFLFNATIGENIGYAKDGATREEIEAAAKAASIHRDIMDMPDGYDTKVGERGVRLSGGQKQRVAIARAILTKAPVIILDEATASVDTRTESAIQRAIDGMAGSRTVVVIAHRLSTVRHADTIIVLRDGHIAEQGTHEELIARGGLYADMCSAQDEAEE